MGYSREIFESAQQTLSDRRNAALQKAQRRREEFYARCPRAGQIENELSALASRTARTVLQSGNSREALEKLRDRSLMLQKERAELLTENRLPQDYLETKFTCDKCRDTGYIDGKACSCLRDLLRQETLRRLNEASPLAVSSFRDLSLDYYGENRAEMKKVISFCREYAASFSLASPSLLMVGGTGLGKTHLSLAIAGEAIEKNYGVLYGTVSSFARTLERERFSQEDEDLFASLQTCDLLILDDLGTEVQSAYITSSISEIVDTRLLRRLPTIITTNLSASEMERRYNERFVSRVFGSYQAIRFLGSDIRLKKRRQSFGTPEEAK